MGLGRSCIDLRNVQVRSHCQTLAAALGILLTTTPIVAGQTAVQANIVGVVTDESGAVLPGVTISAKSPALQVKQVTAVTDGEGAYRLSAVPIGSYEVTYTLDGFQTLVREGIRLTAGFTAQLNVSLKLGAIEQSVTVRGASPVVDVASTTATTSLTRETLELIPTNRDGVQAMLAQAPGVRSNMDVGGNTVGAIPQFRAFGQTSGSWPVVEGVSVKNVGVQAQTGLYLDYAGMEEVQVSTLGNDAEVPTRGIHLSMIVKSGGNAFHGSFLSAVTGSSLISNNIDANLASQGIRGLPILERWDAGGDFSGHLVRDKVWFYGGTRQRVNDNGVLDCTKPDGTQCHTDLTQRFHSGKVTYQLNDAQRFIGYYQWNLKDNVTGASSLVEWGSRFHQDFTGSVGKGEWQGTVGDRLLANALVGYWDFNSWQYGFDTAPSTLDIVTQRRRGSSSQIYYTPIGYKYAKYHIKGTLSWYTPNAWLGDHNIKGGLDLIKNWNIVYAPPHENGDYILLFSNDAPFQIQVFNHPVESRNDDNYNGIFVKDQWRVTQRLTLNLGGRLAFDRAYVPAQGRQAGQFASIYPSASFDRVDLPSWNTFVPRVHAAFDVTNDGKTIIKGGWGRFAEVRLVNDGLYVNQTDIRSTTFVWRDMNGNRDYDPVEVNLDPNGTGFVSQTGSTLGILNLDEKAPISDEFSVSIERQLVPDLAVRVTGIYSRDTNVIQQINPLIPFEAYTIPITNRDPGPDGILGNNDDPGTTITYWEYPRSLQGSAFQAATRVNDPRLDRSFASFEIAASKRLSNKWQAMASYSQTKSHVPGGIASPNQQIFGDDNTTEWTAKAAGSYILPYDILAAVNYEVRSGIFFQRTHLFRGGTTIPTIVLPVEPLGDRHYDHVHRFDARVKKDFRVRNHVFSAGADIFNVFNVNTVTSVNTRSGPTFGRTLTPGGNTATLPFIPGRNVQFTVGYSF